MRGGPPRIYVKVAEERGETCAGLLSSLWYAASIPQRKGTHLTCSSRVGTIRERAGLRPTVQIWRRSAVKWLEDLESVPGSPEQQALTAQ